MAFYGALFGTPCSRSAPSSATTASSSPSGQSSAEDLVVVVQFHGNRPTTKWCLSASTCTFTTSGRLVLAAEAVMGAGGETRTPNLLLTRHVATVRGMLARAVLAAQVRRVVQPARS